MKRLIEFINFRRGQATDLILFLAGTHSIRGILTPAIIAKMANIPSKRKMAHWVPYNKTKHGDVSPFFTVPNLGVSGVSGQAWLEPTKRGKFWMIIVLITGLKND